MRVRFGVLTLLFAFWQADPALSQAVASPGPPTSIACAYNSPLIPVLAGQASWVQCDSQGRLILSDQGGSGSGSGSLATSQSSVTTASTQLCAARPGRRAVTVENLSTTPFYIGPTGVSATTGFLVPGSAGTSVTVPTSAAIYGLTASGTSTAACLETF